jgi:hypothetical protein
MLARLSVLILLGRSNASYAFLRVARNSPEVLNDGPKDVSKRWATTHGLRSRPGSGTRLPLSGNGP